MSPLEVLLAVCNDEPEPLAKHNARVSSELQRVVDRCLSKASEGRYATAREFVSALDEAAKILGPSAPEPAKASVAAGESRETTRKLVVTPTVTISASSQAGPPPPPQALPTTVSVPSQAALPPQQAPTSTSSRRVIVGMGLVIFLTAGTVVAVSLSRKPAPIEVQQSSNVAPTITSTQLSLPESSNTPARGSPRYSRRPHPPTPSPTLSL